MVRHLMMITATASALAGIGFGLTAGIIAPSNALAAAISVGLVALGLSLLNRR